MEPKIVAGKLYSVLGFNNMQDVTLIDPEFGQKFFRQNNACRISD